MIKQLTLLALLTLPASAYAMDLATFLTKANALEKKGAMAMFSSDLRLLMNEGKTASAQLRAERLADVKAGRKPDYCPPAKGGTNSNEVLAYMRAIPPAQRGISFKTAMAGFLAKKFPCPA